MASLKCGPNLLFTLSKIVVCSGYQRQMTFTRVFPAGGEGVKDGAIRVGYMGYHQDGWFLAKFSFLPRLWWQILVYGL